MAIFDHISGTADRFRRCQLSSLVSVINFWWSSDNCWSHPPPMLKPTGNNFCRVKHVVGYCANPFLWLQAHDPKNIQMETFLLFRGVVELVLSGTTEAFLDAAVFPQSLHYRRQFASKTSFLSTSSQRHQLTSIFLHHHTTPAAQDLTGRRGNTRHWPS